MKISDFFCRQQKNFLVCFFSWGAFTWKNVRKWMFWIACDWCQRFYLQFVLWRKKKMRTYRDESSRFSKKHPNSTWISKKSKPLRTHRMFCALPLSQPLLCWVLVFFFEFSSIWIRLSLILFNKVAQCLLMFFVF